MITILDLPTFLDGNLADNKQVKTLCVVNKQIKLPKQLDIINRANSNSTSSVAALTNVPVLVDIIGMEISNKQYLVYGQAVAILGPNSLRPLEGEGKRLLVLNSYINQINENNHKFVELVNIFKNRKTGQDMLYATTTLLREDIPIYETYPEMCKFVDILKQNNWDFEKSYSAIGLPSNYHIASKDYSFYSPENEIEFTYKKNEYKKNEYKKNDTNFGSNFLDTSLKKELVSRKDICDKPANFFELDKNVELAEEKVEKNISDMTNHLNKKVSLDDIITKCYRNLKSNWYRSPLRGVMTGRAIFKDALERVFSKYKHRYIGSISFIDDALDNNNVLDIWYTADIPKRLEEHKNKAYSSFYTDVAILRTAIFICILDSLLVLRGRLMNTFLYSPIPDINIFNIMLDNPYYLTLLDNRLKIDDLDKLAMLFKVDLTNDNVIKFRNAAYLHNYLSDNSNDIINDNTIISYDELKNVIVSGYIFNKYGYTCVQDFGIAIHPDKVNNLKEYIYEDTDINSFVLPKNGWKQMGYGGSTKYIYKIKNDTTNENLLQDYIDSGLGIALNFDNKKYISDFNFAQKEKYIINRLYELQEKGYKPSISDDDLERCIRGFERQKALDWNITTFKLEDKQIEAVKLLYNSIMCLTGPAGSGKTTTAEAMLYALEGILGYQDDEIMFCAPTGKAASRLREIVKKPTRTINSLFGIGLDCYTLYDLETIKKKDDISVLIVDESSMINIDLMYNMITKIKDGTRIIFMGDREQLPSIGFGKPFSNILSFLPCVVLNVTKRASSNSGITRNAEKLIYHSDISNPPALESCGDFRILSSVKDDIVKLVSGIVLYHTGKSGSKKDNGRTLTSLGVDLIPDDIQVVTPVNKHNWGTKHLNKCLQNIFNPKVNSLKYKSIRLQKGYSDNTEYIDFRVGDRVIHLENDTGACRLIRKSNGSYMLCEDSMGVMNGDIGKIVNISNTIKFEDINGAEDAELKDMFPLLSDNSLYYVAVEYLDMDISGNQLVYTILYSANKVISFENDKLEREENTIEVLSPSLNKLDLAYALTVHKLQGSQAKLIICVMFKVDFHNSFISRNMIYTAITRASEGVYLIGDVIGFNSAIEKGRKIEQNLLCHTIMDMIYQ